MERHDRYGTAKADTGPSSYIQPWVSATVADGWAISHGPALAANGLGFFGNWNGFSLYKFDWRTGQLLGRFDSVGFVTSTPALGTSDVFFKVESQHLFGLDPTIMDYDWFTPTQSFAGSPILGPDGNIVEANTAGVCYRFTQTGNIVWSHSGLATAHNSVAFTRDDAKVLVPTNSGVTALNYADGSQAWTVSFGNYASGVAVSASGVVVAGDGNHVVHGLDPNDGHTLWTFTALGSFDSAPAIDGDYAYLCNTDARLYKFDCLTGHRMWSFTAPDFNPAPPSIGHDGRVYFESISQNLFCVSPSGSQIWVMFVNGQPRGPLSIGNDGTLYICRDDATGTGNSGMAIIRQTPATVTGTIHFNDFVGTPPSSGTFELYLRGTQNLVASATGSIDSTGAFSVSFAPSFQNGGNGANGIYDISLEIGTWLRRRVPVTLNTGSATGVTLSLINGDINGDNHINLTDFSLLRAAFGTSLGDANFNANADLNGDHHVSLSDFSILRRNFGQIGD